MFARVLAGIFLAPAATVLALATGAQAGTPHHRYEVPVDYDCDDVTVGDKYEVKVAGFEYFNGPVLVVTVPDVVGVAATPLDGGLSLLVYEGRVEDEYLDGDPLVPLYVETGVWENERYYFEVDEGWHTVVFDFENHDAGTANPTASDYEAPAIFEIRVNCPRPGVPWIPSFGVTLPTTTTTTPANLPRTGSDNSSLLVVAPLLMLIGGGLIAARRRVSIV